MSFVLLFPKSSSTTNGVVVPGLWPVALNILHSLRRIKEECSCVNRRIFGHSVIFVEHEPSHLDGMKDTAIKRVWL
jgi:hypothetical protein